MPWAEKFGADFWERNQSGKPIGTRYKQLINIKNMETIGILVQKLGERSGVSQRTGNPWKMAEYLVEVPGQYPKKIKFDVSDGTSGKIAHFDGLVGKMVTVYWDIDASEYNGRWYNTATAWGCKEYVAGQVAQTAGEAAGTTAAPTTEAAPIEPSANAEQTKLKLTQMAEQAAIGEEGKEGEDDLPF